MSDTWHSTSPDPAPRSSARSSTKSATPSSSTPRPYEPTSYAVEFNDAFPPGDEYTPDAYVSEYAASSPEDGAEDIAESWAMFVFSDTRYAGDADDDGELDVVCTDCVAADKVAFFADYPELVDLAEQIRQNAGV